MSWYSYRELGPLFHDLVSQHSWRNRPVPFLLTANRVWYWPGTAGVLHGWLQRPVHPGPCHRALVGWWCPAPAAAGLALRTSAPTPLVLPGCPGDGRTGWAAWDAAKRRGTLWTPELAAAPWQGSVHGHRDRHEGWCHLPWANAQPPTKPARIFTPLEVL